jgi:UDP-N-acetylglucosamine 2-epimerase (non-hydrolysing)
MKLAIVVGTRPEIIKMAPVVRACQKKNVDFFIVHSGQHYDYNMDAIFFDELDLPRPKYNIQVGSKEYRKQVGNMVKGMQKIFLDEMPDCVIVEGDTLTVLIAALAAKKWDIPVAHHEAGLRSHDLTMPEEINRIITDHISEYLFSPTPDALHNIQEEGFNAQYYVKTGNTIVDAVKQNLKIANKKSKVMANLGLKPKKYIIVTVHRQENTNYKERLEGIMEGIARVAVAFPDYMVVFSMHPRTVKKLAEHNIELSPKIKVIEPVGFLEFLQLEKYAALCITDSGGIQEECSILHVPVVTVRDNTERPETIKAGMNMLAGTDSEKILEASKIMMKKKIQWKAVFGDGRAGERIVDNLIVQIKKRKSMKERMKWIGRMARKNVKSLFRA